MKREEKQAEKTSKTRTHGGHKMKKLTQVKDASEKMSVGDLFYTSWGYDQTNYDYIIIESVSKSGKTVKCRRASHEHLGNSSGCDIQKPIKEPFGDQFQMRVKKSYCGKEIVLRGSYPFYHTGKIKVTEWGKSGVRLDTFNRVDENRTYSETDAYSGH